MRVIINDEDHERFNQTGELIESVEIAEHLNSHTVQFPDGESERFLSYQIDSVKESNNG